jgi:hypothetical protein
LKDKGELGEGIKLRLNGKSGEESEVKREEIKKKKFVYRNEDCIADCQKSNQRLAEYLFWYNTQRFHRGLNYQSPFHYTLACINTIKSIML